MRNFMILARYCSKTVFEEQRDCIRQQGSIFWPNNLVRYLRAWSSFMRVEVRLSLYEYYIALRRFLRLAPVSSI